MDVRFEATGDHTRQESKKMLGFASDSSAYTPTNTASESADASSDTTTANATATATTTATERDADATPLESRIPLT